MGGKLALVAAIEDGDRFALVAPFYGAVADMEPKNVRMPVCGSYGATRYRNPGARTCASSRAALTCRTTCKIYDEAGHAFFDDQRASYVESAAADAWTRTGRVPATLPREPAP